MDHLLISFCNAQPGGLSLGRYCFETREFAWVAPQAFPGAAGICSHNAGYYILAQQVSPHPRTSLATLDRQLRVVATAPLERVLDGHSLMAVDDRLLAVSTGSDEIIGLRWTEAGIEEEVIWRASTVGSDTLHLNSIVRIDGRIHASCFGRKPEGGWHKSRNGQVIDITSGETVCRELLHPHSLFLLDGQPHVLDSRTAEVLEIDTTRGLAAARWHLTGYIRGAVQSGRFLYVAASAYRSRAKSTGASRGVPRDAETRSLLHRIDTVTGQVETHSLTPFGAEIYDLAIAPALPFEDTREDAMQLRLRMFDTEVLPELREMESAVRCRILYDAELHRLINEDSNHLAASFVLERLLKRDPFNGDWQYHYGVCLLQLGGAERAIPHFEKALALGYSEFWGHYHLASAHFSAGHLEEARRELSRAETLQPSGSDTSVLREWIEAAVKTRSEPARA